VLDEWLGHDVHDPVVWLLPPPEGPDGPRGDRVRGRRHRAAARGRGDRGAGQQRQEQLLHKQVTNQDNIPAILIQADKVRMTQVIDNLVSNALKFTTEGIISLSVKTNDNGQAVVSVKDSGQGIDPNIFPKLFTKFVTKSEFGGTGLGLFISKSIVEAHGGKIWAENNPNEKGATFSFSLPLMESSWN